MAVSDEQVAAATSAQAVMLGRASTTLLDLLLALVRGFSGWYSRPLIAEMTSQAVAFVEAAQLQAVATTDTYLSQVASDVRGRPVAPSGALSRADVGTLRRGVSHQEVYGRLADQFRYESSLGTDPGTVLEHVENRARSLAGMDLQLAQREQEHKFMVVRHVDGWRRVLHPELVSSRSKDGTVGEVCGLCVAASDRVYSRETLRPIHAGDRCTVAPIINGVDPGGELNRRDLDELYRLAGGTTDSAKLKRVKFRVNDHGELGAVLTAAEDSFRGPDDVPETVRAA